MPLQPDFTWRQTSSHVIVEVALKRASPKSVDILATPSYLKVSFERYLLQLDLTHEIDDDACSAKVKQGTLVLKMKKLAAGHEWDALHVEGLSKEEARQRRDQAIKAREEKEQNLAEKAKQRKADDERKALRKQMALEEDERQHLDDLKAEEKQRAETDVYQTFEKMNSAKRQQEEQEAHRPPAHKLKAAAASGGVPGQGFQSGLDEDDLDDDEMMQAMLEEDDTSDQAQPKLGGTQAAKRPAPAKGPEMEDDFEMLEYTDVGAGEDGSAESEDKVDEQDEEDVWDDAGEDEDLDGQEPAPDPRAGGVVKFNFTPRIFPTPMRESKQVEEEDWIAKNRRHLRKNPVLKPQLDALDIEDSDPVWLKGKGDDMYRSRDYRGAVNAYTTALEIDADMLPCLANRAAAYLHLAELVRCIEDCDLLLQTLERNAMGVDANPNDEQVHAMMIKALVRRGTAFCQQGKYPESLKDYERAAAMRSDQNILNDVAKIERLCRCDQLKRDADAKLAGGDFDAALSTYTRALALEPTFVSALSNRAACHMAMSMFAECVGDCTKALDLLQVDPGHAIAMATSSSGVAPYKQQEQQQMLLSSSPLEAAQTSTVLPAGPIPPAGSAKRRAWVLKTIARRGNALAQLGQLAEAVDDFRVAVKLDEGNKELAADLRVLEEQLASDKSAGLSGAGTGGEHVDEKDDVVVGQEKPCVEERPGEGPMPTATEPTPQESPVAPPSPPAPTATMQTEVQEAVEKQIRGCKTTYTVLSEASPHEDLGPPSTSQQVCAHSTVTVHARGMLQQSGEEFWNTRKPGQRPFTYKAGVGGVIKGWDQGCLGMHLGEKRLLRIPSAEAYGSHGFRSWGIPPDADLVFELEVIRIQK